MSDSRGPDFRDEPSLDAIRNSDDFIDALATGRPVTPQGAADAELAALLGGWRDEMRFPPATGLISESDAIAALNAGLAEKPSGINRENREKWAPAPKRSRRGLSVVGAAAAAVMCIGGFGAVVAGAGPGDALYGLRTMLFGAPKQIRDDQVALAARTELNQVQDLITRGDWQQAQDKLVAVSTQVATIGDEQQKQELMDQFNDLSAKVVERDPEATAPPGIIYTVPPSAADLVPAVAPPTSTPSAPSPTDSATTTPESASSSTSSAGTTAAPTTTATPTSAAPTTTPTSAAPTTTAAATTTAAPATTSAPATITAPTTTAPTTTAAPATTSAVATTTSVAQATSAASTATTSVSPKSTTSAATTTAAATTSAAPAAAATTTTTTAAPATVATTTAAPAQPTTTAQATTSEVPKPQAPVTTTTVVIPLPVPAG